VTVAARLAAFAAVLVLAGLTGFGLGSAVGPLDGPGDDAHSGTQHSRTSDGADHR
jgi:hypothetical protein